MGELLAEDADGGRILICPHCEDVHWTMENVSLRLRREVFLGLSRMLQEAARKLFPSHGLLATRAQGAAPAWPGAS
jgi:hypothetical protein